MKKIILLLICVTVFVSCKKDKTEGPQGPAGANGNVPSGTITGKVTQYDQFGAKSTTSLNTTTVKIESTNYFTVTDSTGTYSLNSIAPGTYNISFTKPGYGVIQKQQITFAANGTFYLNADILEKATYSFINASVKDTVVLPISTPRRWVTINSPSSPNNLGAMIISGSNSNIDITNPASYSDITFFSIPPNTTSYTYAGFFPVSGTVYYKIYPYGSAPTYGSYYDYPSDHIYYTSYGAPIPTTFSITAP